MYQLDPTVLDPSQPQPQPATSGRQGDITNSALAIDVGTQQPPAPVAPVVGPPALSQNAPSQDDINNYMRQQAATQQRNALQDQIQRDSNALNETQPTSNRGGPVKRLLFSFLSEAGDAMRRDVGLPTQFQQQQAHVQNLVTLSNAAALDDLRNAQVQGMQLVTRQMPDGSIVQIPQAHVSTFDAAMARTQQQQQAPNLNDLIGRTVYSAIQAGRDPNADPVVTQLLQIQRGMQKPPADSAAAQKDAFTQGIQPAIAANEITPPMLTDVRQLITGIQNSKAIPQQGKPALISYLIANPTPASQGTQAAVKINLEDQNKPVATLDTKQGNSLTYLSPADINARNAVEPGRYAQPGSAAQVGKTGYAYDPQNNQTVLTNQGEAAQKGYTAFRPVTEANIRNDTHDTKILNDVASKANNLTDAAKAVEQGPRQLAVIAQLMDAADKDAQFKVGAFGTQIPTSWFNNLFSGAVGTQATQLTRNYVVSLLSLREASMGMQRLLTGTARANESQIKALQATLPGVEPDSRMVLQKMQAFTQNLDMLRQGIPILPGITTVPVNRPWQQLPSVPFNIPQPFSRTNSPISYNYSPQTDSLVPVNA